MKIKKINTKDGYLLPDKRAYVDSVSQALIDKVNEIIDLISKPVETTNEQPKYLDIAKICDLEDLKYTQNKDSIDIPISPITGMCDIRLKSDGTYVLVMECIG